jgi:transcription antitermination protein NusB
MKTTKDPRHQNRRDTVKALFAESFTHQSDLPEIAKHIMTDTQTLDKRIEMAAPSWPIEKINKIDLAILRLAVYELGVGQTPPKVIIDEAVELAKEFGSESSPGFVNGVMATLYTNNTNNS